MFIKTGTQEEINSLALPSVTYLENQTSSQVELIGLLFKYTQIALKQKNTSVLQSYKDKANIVMEEVDPHNTISKMRLLSINKAYSMVTKDYEDAIATMTTIHRFDKKLLEEKRVNSINNLEGQISAKEKECSRLAIKNDVSVSVAA